jgi:hypothetical protein
MSWRFAYLLLPCQRGIRRYAAGTSHPCPPTPWLTSGIALLAAWLLMLATVEKATWPFWRRYAATVGICILAGLVAAFVLLFLVQGLLDAGKI